MAASGSSPGSWLRAGMDPKSTYLLQVRLLVNPKERRPEFSCYRFDKTIDSDICNFKDLVNDIADEFPHGYGETVTVFYYDAANKNYPQVKSDQELLAMFTKHIDTMVVRLTITYSKPTDMVFVPDPEDMGHNDTTIPSEPTKPTSNQPTNRTTHEPTSPSASQPNDATENEPITNEFDDDKYLLNPEPHNEHVGIDEEGLYLTNAKVGAAHTTVTEDSDSTSVSNSDSDEEYEEEDGLVGKDPQPPHVPVVAYDKDDPPMSVGSIYENMEVFKLAIAQHAIKREFEFNIEKSDPGRFRAYCSRKNEGCRWRIHASKMKDNVTIEVKKNPRRHNCCSTRRSKQVKNATKFWVCDQVKDWLTEDASLGAKELQRRLKDKTQGIGELQKSVCR
ncbi:hypothetical protein QOZ80_2BG0177830 [Eleusine coracana subsp. coracana]|nr:hypothetical protein QOZ80_2BG0177830 [Eleusine coracana subsp. coracana]